MNLFLLFCFLSCPQYLKEIWDWIQKTSMNFTESVTLPFKKKMQKLTMKIVINIAQEKTNIWIITNMVHGLRIEYFKIPWDLITTTCAGWTGSYRTSFLHISNNIVSVCLSLKDLFDTFILKSFKKKNVFLQIDRWSSLEQQWIRLKKHHASGLWKRMKITGIIYTSFLVPGKSTEDKKGARTRKVMVRAVSRESLFP